MMFSIIIITRNRAGIIANVLGTIKSLQFPAGQFELIVVDNGSNDGTQTVVRNEMAAKGINWMLVEEGVPGMCRARNAGIARATGTWVAFLDDDALVNPDWLDAYSNAIDRYPDAAALGGPATLDHRLPRPWWWCSKFDLSMSCQDYGEVLIPYTGSIHPYGVNMVFNRQILERYNGFDVSLDAVIPGLGDETDLFFRMKQNGESLIYVPQARVIHSVLPDRLQWGAFSKRCIHIGRTLAYLNARRRGRPNRWLIRRLMSATVDFIRYPTPAVYAKECLEWYGYISFRKKVEILLDGMK